MATRIEIDYERLFVNSEVQEIIARSAASLNVLQQLGATYQNLPGLAMAAYQAEADALENALATYTTLVDQVRAALIDIDSKATPLFEKNKKVLKTLSGLLQSAAQLSLLDQITGPTHTPPSQSPPPQSPIPPPPSP